MSPTLTDIATLFAWLSLWSFGGVTTILPEMQRIIVEQHGWLDAADFTTAFAIARAAPGPNVMIVALIGWKLAGASGAAVALTAVCAPPSLIAFAVYHSWQRWGSSRWRRIGANALAPPVAGLVLASAWVLGATNVPLAGCAAISAATALIAWRSDVSPIWLLCAGAAAGALLL